MQKGFASLEIILAVLIIALLATVAVPNAARFVDRAAVDYEQKRLYNELQFLRTFDRTATVSSKGTGLADFVTSKMTVGSVAILNLDLKANSYQIFRADKTFREPHNLSYGVTFSDETDVDSVSFKSTSGSNVNSKTIVLKSRRGHKLKIVFDSVGRIRGGK